MNPSILIESQAPGKVGDLVQPILGTRAFNRLKRISFLGILSPRYAKISKSPIHKRRSLKHANVMTDGSRADHSVGVASIAVEICQRLGFSIEQQKYAAAWGVLHDLGNWPLSHSAQHAFSELLGTKAKDIRGWLITNDPRAPEKYFVANELRQCGVDPHRLLNLFQKSPDDELRPVFDLLQSRLTPDMIEGVWRSGRAFGIHRFEPCSLNNSLYIDLAQDVVVHNEYLDDAVVFWRTKREIYSRFFASKGAVEFESKWSKAVFLHFEKAELTLQASLDLDEVALVARLSEHIDEVSFEIHRWKPPVRQRIKKPFPKTLALRSLDKTFIEEIIEVKVNDEDRLNTCACI